MTPLEPPTPVQDPSATAHFLAPDGIWEGAPVTPEGAPVTAEGSPSPLGAAASSWLEPTPQATSAGGQEATSAPGEAKQEAKDDRVIYDV